MGFYEKVEIFDVRGPGSHPKPLSILIKIGGVQFGGRKTSPRTSSVVQFIFYFDPLRSARKF